MTNTDPRIVKLLEENGLSMDEAKPEDIAWAANKLGIDVDADTQNQADEFHARQKAQAEKQNRFMRSGERKIDRR